MLSKPRKHPGLTTYADACAVYQQKYLRLISNFTEANKIEDKIISAYF